MYTTGLAMADSIVVARYVLWKMENLPRVSFSGLGAVTRRYQYQTIKSNFTAQADLAEGLSNWPTLGYSPGKQKNPEPG